MEANRIWHQPRVEIFSNLITRGECCEANAYDLANRRWYKLHVDSEDVPEDEWMAAMVDKHIKEYYAVFGKCPPWNTIRTNPSGYPVSFTAEPDEHVAKPITNSLSYGSGPADKLPTTTLDQLLYLYYLNSSVDRCKWNGQLCVFKRIEFSGDPKHINTEIRAREKLIDALSPIDRADINDEMIERFRVVPILAVVIAHSKPWKPGTVAGFLMPYAGADLEKLVLKEPKPDLPITETHVRDLVRGIHELAKCGSRHGDIKYWNVVLETGEDGAADKVTWIDLGSKAGEYEGDAKALGKLLLWFLEHSKGLREGEGTKTRIEAAAAALSQEDIGFALRTLSDGALVT